MTHLEAPRRAARGLAALVGIAALAGSGCNHYRTQVPGVLDLRPTQGAVAGPAPAGTTSPTIARSSTDALLSGAGYTTGGTEFRVEDRTFWFWRLVPVMNPSAEEELQAAVSATGAVQHVKLGDRMTVVDVGISLLASILPIVGWFAPPFTFVATGEHVRGSAAPGANADVTHGGAL
jgi:hypothetical protein